MSQGVNELLLILRTAFIGYVLPWGQISFYIELFSKLLSVVFLNNFVIKLVQGFPLFNIIIFGLYCSFVLMFIFLMVSHMYSKFFSDNNVPLLIRSTYPGFSHPLYFKIHSCIFILAYAFFNLFIFKQYRVTNEINILHEKQKTYFSPYLFLGLNVFSLQLYLLLIAFIPFTFHIANNLVPHSKQTKDKITLLRNVQNIAKYG
ncbi:hypothetical protein L9F63_024573, partial [Diploptera punctata]